MRPGIQAKLLRALQDRRRDDGRGTARREGGRAGHRGHEPGPRGPRAAGRFREDLYYRLNVLADRPAAAAGARRRHPRARRPFPRPVRAGERARAPRFTRRALAALRRHAWPGNVRELANLVQRLVVMTDKPEIDAADLPSLLRFAADPGRGAARTLAEVEAAHVRSVLASAGGNRTRAAEILGIDRKTLGLKLRKFPGSTRTWLSGAFLRGGAILLGATEDRTGRQSRRTATCFQCIDLAHASRATPPPLLACFLQLRRRRCAVKTTSSTAVRGLCATCDLAADVHVPKPQRPRRPALPRVRGGLDGGPAPGPRAWRMTVDTGIGEVRPAPSGGLCATCDLRATCTVPPGALRAPCSARNTAETAEAHHVKKNHPDDAAYARALEAALAAPALDERTARSRLRWLLDPRPEGIRLGEEIPGLGPEELARHIVHPREAVLGVIERRTGLARPLLERIYECLRAPDGSEDRLADLPEERILQEMKWWLADLDFPAYYLANTPPEVIAAQILANRSWEMLGSAAHTNERMKVSMVSREGTRMHWVHRTRCLEVEEEIERDFAGDGQLRDVSVYTPFKDLLLYLVEQTPPGDGDEFSRAAPRGFLAAIEPQARRRYEEVRAAVLAGGGIVVARSFKQETGEHRVMIGFPRGAIIHFLANVNRSMARDGIEVTRKYAVTFGGERPVMVTTLYARQEFPADLATHLVEVGLYPSKGLSDLVESGALTPAECTFAHAVTLFVHQFIRVRDPDLALLAERFGREGDLASIVETLQARIDRDAFPMAAVEQVLRDRPDHVRDLFTVFRQRLDPAAARGTGGDARARLEAAAGAGATGDEAHVVHWALAFVDAVERTNVFLPSRLASCFRLSSRFLADAGARVAPFGVFFVVGRDFHGFHVRFADIARGGIRIVRSATGDDHARNSDSLFEECYNLAFTQHRKNKDIPEGGAKGVVLPGPGRRPRRRRTRSSATSTPCSTFSRRRTRRPCVGWSEEILFLGPDEGSADLMGWAALHARHRGYRYWKAFTTGKEASLGGISHKEHGMTTQGVHRYVLGILRELGSARRTSPRCRRAGPTATSAPTRSWSPATAPSRVVDGGGVHLGSRRARPHRARASRAGGSRLGRVRRGPPRVRRGFAVRVADRDKRLGDGTVVASGTGFRNSFHLDPRCRADLFVPCGGRPKSINLANWRSLLDAEGRPAFRWIVEGANLFITQEARLKLEEKGVAVFKDSSTNKGGVISSSLEVLAALAMDDEGYARLMCTPAGAEEPEFRHRYIAEVVRHIVDRADREFDLLWRVHRATGRPLSVLADEVSARINEITDEVAASSLVNDPAMRLAALRLQVPGAPGGTGRCRRPRRASARGLPAGAGRHGRGEHLRLPPRPRRGLRGVPALRGRARLGDHALVNREPVPVQRDGGAVLEVALGDRADGHQARRRRGDLGGPDGRQLLEHEAGEAGSRGRNSGVSIRVTRTSVPSRASRRFGVRRVGRVHHAPGPETAEAASSPREQRAHEVHLHEVQLRR